MIVDRLLTLSGVHTTAGTITPQTVTGTNTSVLSTDAIDLSQNRDIAQGQDLYARIQVIAAATGGTSVDFQIIVADDAATTTNVTVIGSSGAIPIASLTAGARLAVAFNLRLRSLGQRYLALRYVIVGAMTTGSYIGDIGVEIQDGQKFYPSGYAIL